MPRRQVIPANMVAYYPGEAAWTCARLNSEDVEGIARVTREHLGDGADRVTIAIHGTEYDPGAWIGYVSGSVDFQTLAPLPDRP